jgi:hypothetical protein
MSITDIVRAHKVTTNTTYKNKIRYPITISIDDTTFKWYQFMFGDIYKIPSIRSQDVTTHITYSPDTGMVTVPNHRVNYHAGYFVSYTIDEIAAAVALVPSWAEHLKLSIEFVNDGTSVGKQHYDSQDNDVFQVDSKFNALEMDSFTCTPDMGIRSYPSSKTQGSECAVACAPGTLVRNWFYNKLGVSSNDTVGNNTNHINAYNALSKVKYSDGIDLTVTGGYLLWKDNPEPVYEAISKHYGKIQIPCQIYTQVCGPIIDKGKHLIFPKASTRLVHQVYSGSAPINSYGNGGNSGDVDYQTAIAASLQQAAYYGVLGMAVVLGHKDETTGRKTVNLTLVGTGKFNNDASICLEMMIGVLKVFKDYPLRIVINTLKDTTKYRKQMLTSWPDGPFWGYQDTPKHLDKK